MNTNIFEEDPPALFEEDEQYTNAYDEILQNIYESNKQLSNTGLEELWDKIAESEAKVDAKIKRLPGFEVLARSIEHEQNKIATIGEQLKQAQESQNQLLKELNTKRSCLERKFKDVDANELINDTGLEHLANLMLSYQTELQHTKQIILAKKFEGTP